MQVAAKLGEPPQLKAAKGKPTTPTAYRQATELQRLLMDDARKKKSTPTQRASIASQWLALQRMKDEIKERNWGKKSRRITAAPSMFAEPVASSSREPVQPTTSPTPERDGPTNAP